MNQIKTPLERKVDLCKKFIDDMKLFHSMESEHDKRETEAVMKMVEMYAERIKQIGFTNK